ncbi:hypothetical protein H2202_006100 [Exophiala xenobiotica]|nr:hypothetical protein H2202_006100 [Exophiala xenobiotica]
MPELPHEILQSIVHQLESLRDVKNVRLANKTFALMAEPILFHRVGLVPYADCLEDFALMIQNNPTIARHVKALIYEVSARYAPNFRRGSERSSEQAVEFDRHLKDNSLQYHDQAKEIKLFSRCVQLLPGLTSIRLPRPRHGPRPAAFQSYFQRFCQLEGVFDTDDRLLLNEYFELIFKPMDFWTPKVAIYAVESAHKSSITSFRVENLDPDKFFAGCMTELPKVRSVFSKLKDIRIQCGFGSRDATPRARLALVDLVASAADLEELQLSLTDFTFGRPENNGPQTSCLCRLVRLPDYSLREDPMFSSLEYLELGSMACQAIELSALISNHRHTLRRLVLRDLRLVEAHHQDPPPCWVHIFKEIRSYHIPYVELDGGFANPTHQKWQVCGDDKDPTCLSRRVQAWLVGKGEEACPLEHAAVRLDSSGMEILPLEEEGDESFRLDMGEDYPSDELDDEDGEFLWDAYYAEVDAEGWDDDPESDELSSEDEHYVAYRQSTNYT